MITMHHWTGTWSPVGSGPPDYGPCETVLPGNKGVCGKPRHQHQHSLPARKEEEAPS